MMMFLSSLLVFGVFVLWDCYTKVARNILSELRKEIEGMKKHPEMSDMVVPDKVLFGEQGYDKALDDLLEKLK